MKPLIILMIVALQAFAPPIGHATRSHDCESGLVTDMYPTGASLPENVLRFYVYFCHQIPAHDSGLAVFIEDAEGERLSGVFLPGRFSLWSADRRRLTLLLDPGRVKTGLQANVSLGRALRAGQRYSLIVTLHGKPQFRRMFAVTPSDLDRPEIQQWDLSVPEFGGRGSLGVVLDGAFDHHSLAYRIRIHDKSGKQVPGAISIAEEETVWTFVPKNPWRDESYTLVVHPALEDLAGNRITGLFDDPSGENRKNQVTSENTERVFRPRQPTFEQP